MENGMMNGTGPSFLAMEEAKRMYMDRVQKMTHTELYMELMRVHTESSKLLSNADKEIIRLREALEGYDDFASSDC